MGEVIIPLTDVGGGDGGDGGGDFPNHRKYFRPPKTNPTRSADDLIIADS